VDNSPFFEVIRALAEVRREDRPVAPFHSYSSHFHSIVTDAGEFRRSDFISIMEELLCVAAIARLAAPKFQRECSALTSKVDALLRVKPSLLRQEDSAAWESIQRFHLKPRNTLEIRARLDRQARDHRMDISDLATSLWGRETRNANGRGQKARLQDLALTACRAKVNWSLPVPKLTEKDISLTLLWASPHLRAEYDEIRATGLSIAATALTIEQHRFELTTLLSARAAEKALLTAFADNIAVEDLSAKQLDGESILWRSADLRLGSDLVDVKNTRRSKENPESYSEHCVPRFKSVLRTSRADGAEPVLIAGVLSHFLWPNSLLMRDSYARDRRPCFLGFTSEDVIRDLQSEFGEFLELDFSRSALNSAFFLPPWVFDFPTHFYRDRDSAIAELRKLPGVIEDLSEFNDGNIHPLLSVLNLLPVGEASTGKDNPEKVFLRGWASVKQKRGPRLPFLLLSVYTDFLKMASRPGNAGFSPDIYRRALFVGDPKSPGGIFDPLETVSKLIDLLSQLWSRNRTVLREFVTFRLAGFRVLRAKKKDQSWETLIAYCWNCGEQPLVLGISTGCGHCGYLICPKCQSCRKGCMSPERPGSMAEPAE